MYIVGFAQKDGKKLDHSDKYGTNDGSIPKVHGSEPLVYILLTSKSEASIVDPRYTACM